MAMVRDINGKDIEFLDFILNKNCIVLFYPKMGESGKFLPDELLNLQGLTGCTNQCKAYQSNLEQLLKIGFEVFAVGSQSIENMKKFKDDLCVNFTFFSDENFELEKILNLETFVTQDSKKFYHRQTIIIKNGKIFKRFNRIQNPAEDVENVIKVLKDL